MKSIETPNHPAYHWSTLWPLEIWVRGLYNSWWFCVHELSMFIYLSMVTNMFYILFLNSGTTWISFLRKKLGNWCFCTFLNTLFFNLFKWEFWFFFRIIETEVKTFKSEICDFQQILRINNFINIWLQKTNLYVLGMDKRFESVPETHIFKSVYHINLMV